MNKPGEAPARPANDPTDPEPTRDEIAVINERDRDYPAQRAAARPASEVMERLLRRHRAP